MHRASRPGGVLALEQRRRALAAQRGQRQANHLLVFAVQALVAKRIGGLGDGVEFVLHGGRHASRWDGHVELFIKLF